MIKLILSIIVIFHGACSDMFKSSIFDDDVPNLNENRTHISKENLPKPGVTKESEFPSLYPGGHCKRFSFVEVREKRYDHKKIRFSRIYHYIETVNKPIAGAGYQGHIGLERKFLTIFVLDGVVQDFVIIHIKKKTSSGEGKWYKGDLNNFDNGKYLQDWPDASKDLYDYYTQSGNHERLDKESLEEIMSFYKKHHPPATTEIIYTKQ